MDTLTNERVYVPFGSCRILKKLVKRTCDFQEIDSRIYLLIIPSFRNCLSFPASRYKLPWKLRSYNASLRNHKDISYLRYTQL